MRNLHNIMFPTSPPAPGFFPAVGFVRGIKAVLDLEIGLTRLMEPRNKRETQAKYRPFNNVKSEPGSFPGKIRALIGFKTQHRDFHPSAFTGALFYCLEPFY